MSGFPVGSLVTARGREWVVLPASTEDAVIARPLGGADDDIACLLAGIDDIAAASFAPPAADDLGDQVSAGLLRTALRIGFRSGAGPFRSLASLAVEPRAYQLVPLMMALRQETTRLLLADDVGIGKTVEAGLIAAELLATGQARGLAVLCSPALAEQWQAELGSKFGIDTELVLPSTVNRLERDLALNESPFERYPQVVISTDFIKSPRRRDEFVRGCPDLVIVDEAHTCVDDGSTGRASTSRSQRYELLQRLAADRSRHLVLVTATPHSGKDEGFENLLGLLDPELPKLNLGVSANRDRLAAHFVQRRRQDIRKYLDESTPFPATRRTTEAPYRLSQPYAKLFERVLAYVRESVAEGGDIRQRVRWWSALALLRALASSPAAAAATLRTRAANLDAGSVDEADEVGRIAVLDLPGDEAIESADAVPGADDETDSGDTAARRRLQAMARDAEALAGDQDTKLKELTRVVKGLLADGFDPIVFCRFIDTAQYVADHLDRKLGARTTVRAVTGALPPAERLDRIADLAAVEGRHVLVATDCLSEGVNLQDAFSAVVHYDLAWNPTRHEQREGRVDRFGQRKPEVRAVTVYGQDNRIDGIVLEILLRKHEAIRKATGVSVPVPDSSDTVIAAVLEGLLLRGDQPSEQLTLDLGEQHARDDLYRVWESSADNEKLNLTKYAQRAIHPEDVARELQEIREGLGTHDQIAGFTQEALQALGSDLTTQPDTGFIASLKPLPLGLRDTVAALRPAGQADRDALTFHPDLPAPRGEAVLVRTDPYVEAISRYVLDAALDPQFPQVLRPARRCGVIRTREVSTRTTLLLLRCRYHLELPSRNGTRAQVAEEARLVAWHGDPNDPTWLADPQIETLLNATADQNIATDQATRFAEAAIATLPTLTEALTEHARTRAQDLRGSHSRVRKAVEGLKSVKVTAQLPVDVLGVYVYLPVPKQPTTASSGGAR